MIGLLSPVLILLTFAVVLLALLSIFEIGRKRELSVRRTAEGRIWAEVAKRLGGTLSDQGDCFRIRFKWNGLDAALLEESGAVFKVAPGLFGSLNLELQGHAGPGAGWGLRRFDEFPQAFYRGADAGSIRSFLSDPVRRVVRDLQDIGGRNTEIIIDQHLRVAGMPSRDAKSLIRFAVLCLQLAQHAKVFVEQTSAVHVVETGSASTGTCQVCGSDLGGVLVRCARCSTPHHADCWEYAGVCSTYGCGEKTFVA